MSQAPAPAHLVENGVPTEALLAQVAVAKFSEHMPLYRQSQVFARHGILLDRAVLADWMERSLSIWRARRAHEHADEAVRPPVYGRDEGARARSWPGPDQDRLPVDRRARRSRPCRSRSADRRLSLRARTWRRSCRTHPRKLRRRSAGRWICRLSSARAARENIRNGT